MHFPEHLSFKETIKYAGERTCVSLNGLLAALNSQQRTLIGLRRPFGDIPSLPSGSRWPPTPAHPLSCWVSTDRKSRKCEPGPWTFGSGSH